MVDFSTTYLGVKIKNPLIVGSGLTTDSPEICEKAAKDGWAGVVLKSNASQDLNKYIPLLEVPRPRYKVLDHRGIEEWRARPPKKTDKRNPKTGVLGTIPTDFLVSVNVLRTQNPNRIFAGIGNFYNGVEAYLKYISETKKLLKGTGCLTIASIISHSEEGFAEQCDMINRSDADMLEINFSCPSFGLAKNETTSQKIGFAFGTIGSYPEEVAKWCKFVSDRVKGIPIGAKIPGWVPDPLASVRAATKNGMQGITTSMAVPKLTIEPITIDPETLKIGHFNGSPFVTYPLVSDLSITLGNVAQCSLHNIGGHISASGGIREPMDVIRLIMAGASTVQICKLTMVHGMRIAEDFLREIEAFMVRNNYNSIDDMLAIVATEKKLTPNPEKFDSIGIPQAAGGPIPPVMVKLNEKKCISCKWCQEACPRIAISSKDIEAKPVIDQGLYEICGMCVAICPMRALSIEQRN